MGNTMLLDMLSARAAAEENTTALDMIARLRSGDVAAAAPDGQELLARLGDANPLLAAFLQHMKQQREAHVIEGEAIVAAEDVAVVEPDDTTDFQAVEPYHAEFEQRTDDTQELRTQLAALTDEIRVLKDREELLADALGACCLCWGKDRQCRACRGRGTPGYARPDEELFDELVLPAVQMLRACRTSKHLAPPAAHLVEPRVASASSPHS